MTNPFELIIERLNDLESKFAESHIVANTPLTEIINRTELCKRLDITEPTAIRWEKKGKIPCFRIGSNVRYNWHNVINVLEGKNKGGAK
jgi:hypothetical protein